MGDDVKLAVQVDTCTVYKKQKNTQVAVSHISGNIFEEKLLESLHVDLDLFEYKPSNNRIVCEGCVIVLSVTVALSSCRSTYYNCSNMVRMYTY